jgi:DNA mismatch repair protein MutS2
MRLYPDSAIIQLEFDKVKQLLAAECQSAPARQMAESLRIHTRLDFIEESLKQTNEMKLLRISGLPFPQSFNEDIAEDIKLVQINGAMLTGEQWLKIRSLCLYAEAVFRWFNSERCHAYPALALVISHSHYDKSVEALISNVIDEQGIVKDTASTALQRIRQDIFSTRRALNRCFDRVLGRLSKAGYTADIDESFSRGRRVVAVFAEFKRQVKGILHGESDTGKTTFIEPEETIEFNNELISLEQEEQKEIYRILKQLTAAVLPYGSLLQSWTDINCRFDFITAKAKLAIRMNGQFPNLSKHAIIDAAELYHPLLLLYHQTAGKKVQPVTFKLDENNRILVISGPNAGGKTVTMKTIGLCQMMLQSGLLIPVNPASEMGVFKQLFIHIGDTQSLEFDLSTYSSHLIHMKHFIENANGKTLFFIDELGSGTDPNLGGAFAEIIMQELNKKHAIGVITTHYLNLKVMANHTPGIQNASMAFDEKNLMPLYQLQVGKPGSSYTFSIAERIGMPVPLIQRARRLVDTDHFKLDKLLNRTEQDLQVIEKQKNELKVLLHKNEKLQQQLSAEAEKEKHRRQLEILTEQNRLKETKIQQFLETERKLKQAIREWKSNESKDVAIKEIDRLLSGKKEKSMQNKLERKLQEKYVETNDSLSAGALVKIKKNHQVGTVMEIRGKRVLVQLGQLVMNVPAVDLAVVAQKIIPETD